MYKLAVFDMDGTILDTLQDLHDSINYALSECGFPPHTLDEVKSYVGNGVRRLVELSVPEGTGLRLTDKVSDCFRIYYTAHCHDKTCPYAGIEEAMTKLLDAGVKIAVVSNKSDFAVQPLVEEYFHGMIDCAIGVQEGLLKKPAPDMVDKALELLNVERQDAVYIGDSEVDVETAANAHMRCISVAWGFRTAEQLKACGATDIVYNAEDMNALILQ